MNVTGSLVGRDLLSVADLSTAEVGQVFGTATQLKAEYREHRRHLAPPLVVSAAQLEAFVVALPAILGAARVAP